MQHAPPAVSPDQASLPVATPRVHREAVRAPVIVDASELIRVNVWQVPVRLAHWLIFFSFIVVSAEKRNGTLGSIFSGYKFVTERNLIEDAECDRDPGPSFRRWRRQRATSSPALVQQPEEAGE
jgi:hypothetical protein